MKNIVTELSCINASILSAAQNLEKTDRLIIITDEDSSLPISLFEPLSSLKVKPRFIPLKENPSNFMFTLGQLSYECKDNMYLLFPDREYINELKKQDFRALTGEMIHIRVCSTFTEIMKDKASDKKVRASSKSKSAEKETTKKDEPERVSSIQKTNTAKQGNTNLLENESIVPEFQELKDEIPHYEEVPQSDSAIEETTIAPAPKAFIVRLKNIITASNQLGLINTIMQHTDRIALCYREATDCETGLAFLFDIYLSKLFDTDDLYDILYEYYDELKTLAQSTT